MALAQLEAKTFHGLFAIDQLSAFDLGDSGRELRVKFVWVLIETRFAIAQDSQAFGKVLCRPECHFSHNGLGEAKQPSGAPGMVAALPIPRI